MSKISEMDWGRGSKMSKNCPYGLWTTPSGDLDNLVTAASSYVAIVNGDI